MSEASKARPSVAWLERVAETRTSPGGSKFWDFPVVDVEDATTWVRVHEPSSDGSHPCDLFSGYEEVPVGVGIENFPSNLREIKTLLQVLGAYPLEAIP